MWYWLGSRSVLRSTEPYTIMSDSTWLNYNRRLHHMSDKKKITQQLLSNSNYYKMHDRNKLTSQKYTKKFDNLVQETGKVLVFNIQQHN